MSILGPKCGIGGCKKGKLNPHTHIMGSMDRSDADRDLIEIARIMSQTTGQQVHIPGGLSSSDRNRYMVNVFKKEAKDSKKFRESLTDRQRKKIK